MEALSTDHRHVGDTHDNEFKVFLAAMKEHLDQVVGEFGKTLFRTDVDPDVMWCTYLGSFPAHLVQYHDCRCCRQFINTFGGLVTISDDGDSFSAVWPASHTNMGIYNSVACRLSKLVSNARVTGVFAYDRSTWGYFEQGGWDHIAVTSPPGVVFKSKTQTPFAFEAEKREDHRIVLSALADFRLQHIEQAVAILESEQLANSVKVVGPANWLLDLTRTRRAESNKRLRHNLTWKRVATAPAGFCHPRSSMVGTLLEDLAAGKSFAEVKASFNKKMDPRKYQRPTAAPTTGNIARAEKLVEQLGITPSLQRRFARLEEVSMYWRPVEDTKVGAGVFEHLKPKGAATPNMKLPNQKITWVKFRDQVLPTARTLELMTPSGRGSFIGMVTAVHPDSPPILQWDHDERRNPVSWYLHTSGSLASRWGLRAATWVKVNAVSTLPCHWHGNTAPNFREGAVLVLEGARDPQVTTSCLFPEILKSELREIAPTIEAFSRRAQLQGATAGTANGYLIDNGNDRTPVHLRVTSGRVMAEYTVDRWD